MCRKEGSNPAAKRNRTKKPVREIWVLSKSEAKPAAVSDRFTSSTHAFLATSSNDTSSDNSLRDFSKRLRFSLVARKR